MAQDPPIAILHLPRCIKVKSKPQRLATYALRAVDHISGVFFFSNALENFDRWFV
jgi:hypothetical protein